MRRFFLYIASTLLCLFAAVSCNVHQWPEQTVEPELPKITVPLKLEYDTDFYLWEHNYDPLLGVVEAANPSANVFPGHPGASAKYDGIVPSGLIQVNVMIFTSTGSPRCIAQKSLLQEVNASYDTSFDLELPDEGIYDVVVWSQLLKDSEMPSFYNSTNFNYISLILANYEGCTSYRDGFRGAIRVDASAEISESYVVRMKRPMGKFELVTTDLSEFLEHETRTRGLTRAAKAEDYRVIISFPWYYPNAYSALEDRAVDVIAGTMSFGTTMTVTGLSEASMGFDYVVINNSADAGVQVRIDVYRLDGVCVAGSDIITIPLQRDYHTLLRGAFLSLEGSGGVGIDPGFNGDHNVPLM